MYDQTFVHAESSMIRDERCFELYGTTLLDEHLKPWLIEVNASPSMTADSASDKELKTRVFEDVELRLWKISCYGQKGGRGCVSETSNSNSSKNKRPTASKTLTTSAHVCVSRNSLRVRSTPSSTNQKKKKLRQKEQKVGLEPSIRSDENLKEIGVQSSPSSSDDDNDEEEDNEDDDE